MIYIIGENESDWLLIDPYTANFLGGRCAGLSTEDRANIQMKMTSRELFPAIRDDTRRDQIFDSICSLKYCITTIHTFFEDTKHLEPCSRILKQILPGKSKGSLSQYFKTLHNGQAKAIVQTAEFTPDDRTLTGLDASWVSYRVLWLFALRHWPVMDGHQTPRKDIGKPNTWESGLQLRWWVELFKLAADNGYRRMRQVYRDYKTADFSVIEECVRRILPSNYYKIDQELMRRKVRLIYEIISDDNEYLEPIVINPELTSDRNNYSSDILDKRGRLDRSGRPHTSAFLSDEGNLFFDHIYSTSYDTAPKRYLTSFAITRDFFHSFFGTAADDLDQQSSLQLPRDSHTGDRGGEMVVEDAEPPANPRPPPPQVPLPPGLTRPVENMHSVAATSVTLPRRRLTGPDVRRITSRRGRSASPTTQSRRRERDRSNSPNRQRRRDSTSPRGGDARIRDTLFPGAVQQLIPAESTQAAAVSSENVSMEETEVIPQSPPSARPLVQNAYTSPTTPQHRSERRRERSNSTDRQRRNLTNARSRDTIFPGAVQQLLPAESTKAAAVSSEDVSMEETEIVLWAPPSGGQQTDTAIASRSRNLGGPRKITQRGRSTSPTIHMHRSERRRERSTSSHRERRRNRGPRTSRIEDTSTEEMEIVQWVPPPQTVAGPLAERNHSAIIPLASAAPIFSQEVRHGAVSALPDIQLSPILMFSEENHVMFSQETQSGAVSALRQTVQDRTQPSTTPLLVFGQERLIQDITISLKDASQFLFHRRIRTATKSFMVISPAGRDRFRLHKADSTNTASMVNALQLPSEVPTLALAIDQGKRLKLTAPTTILEEARAQRLDTALVVSKQNAGEVIRQLESFKEPGEGSKQNPGKLIRQSEGFEEPDEELRHKAPQLALTSNELANRKGKPILIKIWDENTWKDAFKNVTYDQTVAKVRLLMSKVKGVRPYDYEGNRLAIEDCFHGAQKDALYLCHPAQIRSAIDAIEY
jgi:hypothetical protein